MADIYSTKSDKNSYGAVVSGGLYVHSSKQRTEIPDADFSSLNSIYAGRFLTKIGPEQTIVSLDGTDYVGGTSTTQQGSEGSWTTINFDAGSVEYSTFNSKTPSTYGGRPFDVLIDWVADAGTGNVVWEVALDPMATGEDISVDSFGSNVSTTAAAAPSGEMGSSVVLMTASSMGGLGSGSNFAIKIIRNGADAADTMAGDAKVLSVEVRESAS